MARKTKCLTPGAIFHTTVSNCSVGVRVALPHNLTLNKAKARELEDHMHNAMELVLAPYFVKR